MSTERARLLIRAAIDGLNLPRVGVPPIVGSSASPGRRANATRCNALQPDETPRDGAARAPNEPTAPVPSEPRAAARVKPPGGRPVPSPAGAPRGIARPMQPGATPCNPVKPAATRRAAVA